MPVYDTNNAIQEYERHSVEKQQMLDDLKKIIEGFHCYVEGNSFYYDATCNLFAALYTKQVNLFWCGKQANARICEIGFNAGHSSMLMLMGREKTPVDLTIFDIGHHVYTKPCMEYIKQRFPHVTLEYIEGDSTVTMPKWMEEHSQYLGTYDLIHVDGGHSEQCIRNDMKIADMMLQVDGSMIVDDVYAAHINRCVNEYLASGNYKELDILPTVGYTHRVIYKIK